MSTAAIAEGTLAAQAAARRIARAEQPVGSVLPRIVLIVTSAVPTLMENARSAVMGAMRQKQE
jgi:hypothetical protein